MGDERARVGYDKGRRTQAHIVGRAADAFALHGYDGTSMEQVARSAGLSKGAIYAHFGGKRDLWLACLRTSLSAIAVPPDAAGADPRDRLAALLTWLGRSLAEAPTTRSFFLQVIREQSGDPAALTIVQEVLDGTYASLRGAVRDLATEADADAFAFIAFSALLLDPDLHRFHALMAGRTEPTHGLAATVGQLVESVSPVTKKTDRY